MRAGQREFRAWRKHHGVEHLERVRVSGRARSLRNLGPPEIVGASLGVDDAEPVGIIRVICEKPGIVEEPEHAACGQLRLGPVDGGQLGEVYLGHERQRRPSLDAIAVAHTRPLAGGPPKTVRHVGHAA